MAETSIVVATRLHDSCRHHHHSVAVLRITVLVSDRAVTACPEALECFSFVATSLEPAIAVGSRGGLIFRLRRHWLTASLSPRLRRALGLAVAYRSTKRKLVLSNGDFFSNCKTGPRNLDYLHIRPKLL